jgi:hypothetical protein
VNSYLDVEVHSPLSGVTLKDPGLESLSENVNVLPLKVLESTPFVDVIV